MERPPEYVAGKAQCERRAAFARRRFRSEVVLGRRHFSRLGNQKSLTVIADEYRAPELREAASILRRELARTTELILVNFTRERGWFWWGWKVRVLR